MNYLTNEHGKAIGPLHPLSVEDHSLGSRRAELTSETVTFITGAAGFKGRVGLRSKPVSNPRGTGVGSYWRSDENEVDGSGYKLYTLNPVMYKKPQVVSLVETDGAATITIENENIDMEQMFETPSGARRVALTVHDQSGGQMYGWVGPVAKAGNTYTLDIFNAPTGGSQNWSGTAIATFNNTQNLSYYVYRYEASLVWTTGTILTREVAYDPQRSFEDQLRTLASGEWFLDYAGGEIGYCKATTGTSDTATYRAPGIDLGAGAAGSSTIRTTEGSTSMLVRGTEDEVGADSYTTIITPATACTHLLISLKGTNDAIISLDDGVTEHMVIVGGEAVALDGITISAGVAIKAKNKTAGSNYTNLNISVW